jgi:23S rRNA pseudouridine955/2504/2580 synthase
MNRSVEAVTVRQIRVASDQAGRRIDNFLAGLLKGVPRSRIYRMLRTGEVRVNGGRVQADHRLKVDDLVRIPPVRQRLASAPPAKRLGFLLEDNLLYEDEAIVVLNKPPGLPVHGGSGFSFGVIEMLRALRPNEPYLELAHRLDRDTSGCLMLVKQARLLRQVHDMFRQGTVTKRYLTLVQGRWQGPARIIDEGLRSKVLHSGERRVEVRPEGKQARTSMTPIELFACASLMEVKLLTGRMHQIRVHAAHIGHPVAGDDKYGDNVFNAKMRGYGLRRLFLHAKSLSFKRPDSGDRISVKAGLPEDLLCVLENLRAEKSAHSTGAFVKLRP